jgi:hypothetical protein
MGGSQLIPAVPLTTGERTRRPHADRLEQGSSEDCLNSAYFWGFLGNGLGGLCTEGMGMGGSPRSYYFRAHEGQGDSGSLVWLAGCCASCMRIASIALFWQATKY